jgi:hypothetical protein
VSEARSKVTLRPRSKLERVLDALSDAYEIPSRPELDLLSHLTILLLVRGGAEPAAATAALGPLCKKNDEAVDGALLASASRDVVAAICAAERVDATVEALRKAGEIATRGPACLDKRCAGELGEARWLLGTVPGIDDPRADLLLLYSGTQAIVAPTAHAAYVAARLGYPGSSYAAVARSLDAELPSFDAVEVAWRVHHVLDRHGKELCTLASPQCGRCPVRSSCAYHGQGEDPAAKLLPRS